MYLNNHLNTCTIEWRNINPIFSKGQWSWLLKKWQNLILFSCPSTCLWNRHFRCISRAMVVSNVSSHSLHAIFDGYIIFLCFFSSFFPSTLLSQRLHLSNSLLSESTTLTLNASGSSSVFQWILIQYFPDSLSFLLEYWLLLNVLVSDYWFLLKGLFKVTFFFSSAIFSFWNN